ncbi:hypothetical protein CCACVL1_04318 [Corchorus capsularis]|uniref:Uncharacterized protein n=1 Tax=Corchorus capsularis TaxID=210143 RepID=A0A1R3JTS3_COCAP|nr:hypothetical protein CCACVL1_04318 [Corchorus capsularis]
MAAAAPPLSGGNQTHDSLSKFDGHR